MRHRLLFLFLFLKGSLWAQQMPIEKDSIDYEQDFMLHHAQQGKVSLGAKVGYSHSKFYGTQMDYIFADGQAGWLAGFHVGLEVNSKLSRRFWLKHEILLVQRGAKVKLQDSLSGIYDSKLKTYYIDFYPASPTFHYKGLQVTFGPYVSALVAAVADRKNANGSYFKDHDYFFGTADNSEAKDRYLQKFDFGILAALSYEFKTGLSIGLAYTRGITDIFQYANSYTFTDPKTDKIRIHNQALMLSLGYRLSGK